MAISKASVAIAAMPASKRWTKGVLEDIVLPKANRAKSLLKCDMAAISYVLCLATKQCAEQEKL